MNFGNLSVREAFNWVAAVFRDMHLWLSESFESPLYPWEGPVLIYEFVAGERQPSGTRVVEARAYWNFKHHGEPMRFLAEEFGGAGEIREEGDFYWASYYDVIDDRGRPIGCWPKINRPFRTVKDAVDAIAAEFKTEIMCR